MIWKYANKKGCFHLTKDVQMEALPIDVTELFLYQEDRERLNEKDIETRHNYTLRKINNMVRANVPSGDWDTYAIVAENSQIVAYNVGYLGNDCKEEPGRKEPWYIVKLPGMRPDLPDEKKIEILKKEFPVLGNLGSFWFDDSQSEDNCHPIYYPKPVKICVNIDSRDGSNRGKYKNMHTIRISENDRKWEFPFKDIEGSRKQATKAIKKAEEVKKEFLRYSDFTEDLIEISIEYGAFYLRGD